jgi:hypothetical protein
LTGDGWNSSFCSAILQCISASQGRSMIVTKTQMDCPGQYPGRGQACPGRGASNRRERKDRHNLGVPKCIGRIPQNETRRTGWNEENGRFLRSLARTYYTFQHFESCRIGEVERRGLAQCSQKGPTPQARITARTAKTRVPFFVVGWAEGKWLLGVPNL